MSLMTEIVRGGEPLTLHWGWWHVQCMHDVAIMETFKHGPEGLDEEYHYKLQHTALYVDGQQVLKNNYTCTDPDDGEVLELREGDILRMWHSR